MDFNFNAKNNFWELLGPKISSRIKNAQNLLKFGIFDISNIPISILTSKIFLMNFLPPASPKFVPKLKAPRFYSKFGTFDISTMPISILMSKLIFIKYLQAVRPN